MAPTAVPMEDREVQSVSSRFESAAPEAILRWAIEEYGSGLTMATAFGVEGCVLLAMLAGIPGGRDVRVFNLETGYQFPETLALRMIRFSGMP